MAWEKGQSGNAGGRPKNKPISDMYRKLLVQKPEKLERFCEKIIDMACEGDTAAIKEITDRVEGKPLQSVDVNDNRISADPGQRLAELFSAAAARTGKPDDAGRAN